MPEEKAAPPQAANSKGGGGRSHKHRRKRGGRNRGGGGDRSGGGSSGANKVKGPPQTPTLKVTLRNIHNAAQLGTCRQLGEGFLQVLVQRTNERLATNAASTSTASLESTSDVPQLHVDDASLQRHMDADDAARVAKEAWLKEQGAAATVPGGEEEEGDDVKEAEAAEEGDDQAKKHGEATKNDDDNKMGATTTKSGDKITDKIVEGMEQLQIKNNVIPHKPPATASSSSQQQQSNSVISTRILYMVPPKKTRRRGEKPGCIYLVLSASPIVARPPPQPVPSATEVKSPEENVQAAVATNAAPPPVDYSKDVSQRRLYLQLALDALTKCCVDDAKAQQTLAGCVVEESLSAKTWKDRSAAANSTSGSSKSNRHDRFEGTVQDSADYKQFFAKSEQAKKDLLARPKPAPGGGSGFAGGGVASAAAGSTTGTASAESASATGVGGDAQPVAALIMHLQKKKEEEKKRKQLKKKKESGKKGGGKQESTAGASGGGANNKEGKRKRKGKNKKKKALMKQAQAGAG